MKSNSTQTDGRLQVGPFESHVRTFSDSLVKDGYADQTVRSKMLLIEDLAQWLLRTDLPAKKIDEEQFEEFFKLKRGLHRGDSTTLEQFLDHLRKNSFVPDRKPCIDDSPLTGILCRYEKYLCSERGLAPTTILNYLSLIRAFLLDRFKEEPFRPGEVKASDISDYILRRCHSMAVKRVQLLTSALRSFFRFLFQKGELQVDLAASVPTVADWRLSTVPKYLSPMEVERVLKACNRRTATGRRDYAILLLLARLGLRASEIVSLQMDDINWRAGEFVVRGKGLRHDRMPLPTDVGEALASYLHRDRPTCKTRRVFVCMKAPIRGFAGPSTLTTIVRRGLDRAGLHPAFKGSHLFRHSLATSMLHAGATMREIGEVLRHRVPNTTEIYAKVDFSGMRSLAQPWPIGGGL